MKHLRLLALCTGFTAISAMAQLPYQNPALSPEQRTQDLLARMTLKEKAGQMCQYVGIKHVQNAEKNLSLDEMKKSDARGFYANLHSSEIAGLVERGEIGSFLHVVDVQEANQLQRYAVKSRLGIPLIIGIDAIHGNGMVRGSTIYPAPLSMASSWNPELVKKASRETAVEMRATGSQWTFTPNVDIVRDPRWGRAGETFGEDPFLVAELGAASIEGLQQGDFTSPNAVLANAKHFVAGGDPANGLNASPMDISDRSLRQDYLPPFKRAVDAGVFSFMAAHNEVNGVPAHGSKYLLHDILRTEWGFEGFVVSDWMDIERLATWHKVVPNQKEAVFLTVDAGMDMHMHGPGFLEPIIELVNEGRLSMQRIDASVGPILLAKFRLGLFDRPLVDESAAAELINTAEHRQTALQLAREAIVLLTNNNQALPLKGNERIFVTGPNANNHSIMGDWVLPQPPENIITVMEGLRQLAPKSAKIDYLDVGDQVRELSDEDIRQAGERAKDADVAIVVVGENPLRYEKGLKTSGENVARSNINLFGRQLELIKTVQLAGKPTIVVFVNGRPLAEPWVVENSAAFIEAWEPGALGGQALAEIIFGHVNPSGKLPITIPYSVGHVQAIYNHKPTAYNTKRYADAPTRNLFEFGFGLSYSEFTYSRPQIARARIKPDGQTEVSVEVKNTSQRAGDEVVQLYVRDNISQVTRPVKELKAFRRIHLEAGKSKVVRFEIKPDMLAYYDLAMNWRVEPGDFTLMLGSSSRDKDLQTVQLTVE